MNALSFKNCQFTYASETAPALNGVDLCIEQGKITVLCGKSGSGKSTLLRLMKQEATPAGTLCGEISSSLSSDEIAIIFQNPDTQLVCTTVLHDLVFHMENLGINPSLIKKRLAEVCCFFGIEDLLSRQADELSGGQKQLVALCSSLMVLPKLLLLDEPLSQLDPIASREFLDTLARINREFGITVVVCEHRLNDLSTIADNIALIDRGKIIYSGTSTETVAAIWSDQNARFLPFIPDVAAVSLARFGKPVFAPSELAALLPPLEYTYKEDFAVKNPAAITARDLVFSYKDSDRYVLRRLTAAVEQGKITCILGGNGCGKSTLLKLAAGICKDYLGKLKLTSKEIAYMPQNVWTYFAHDTVHQEIMFDGCDTVYYDKICNALDIAHLSDRHPFDLSGGEAIRVCLASILLRKPAIILLDEPTRGLDKEFKETAVKLLRDSGATILMSSHDLEFAAQFADRCIMLFGGEVAFEDTSHNFFKESNYYTTSLCKAFCHIAKDVVTLKDALSL